MAAPAAAGDSPWAALLRPSESIARLALPEAAWRLRVGTIVGADTGSAFGADLESPLAQQHVGLELACLACAFLRAHARRYVSEWRAVGADKASAGAPTLDAVLESDMLPCLLAQAALLSTGALTLTSSRGAATTAAASAGAAAAGASGTSDGTDDDGWTAVSSKKLARAAGIRRMHAITIACWFDNTAHLLRNLLLLLLSDTTGTMSVPLPAPHHIFTTPCWPSCLKAPTSMQLPALVAGHLRSSSSSPSSWATPPLRQWPAPSPRLTSRNHRGCRLVRLVAQCLHLCISRAAVEAVSTSPCFHSLPPFLHVFQWIYICRSFAPPIRPALVNLSAMNTMRQRPGKLLGAPQPRRIV